MPDIKFEVVSPQQVSSILPLLDSSRFSPYRYLIHQDKERYIRYWLEEISHSARNPTSDLLVALQDDHTVGLVMMDELPWDSQIFQRRMCKISELVLDNQDKSRSELSNLLVSRAIQWARERRYEFMLCKTYTDDVVNIHALENAGFLLVDTLLYFFVDFRRDPWSSIPEQLAEDGVSIRLAKPEDEAELVELAHLSFQHHIGRYHSDPNFNYNQATKVYEQWMRSSLAGYADFFVLAEINNRITGLSIWKKPSDLEQQLPVRIGHYSIGAVHPDFYGRKLFTLLSYEGMKLIKDDVDGIEMPTHINNYPVQRASIKLGSHLVDARHSFHKWL